MRTVSIKLPEGLDERVDQLAKRRGISRSEVIRAAVERYTAAEAESFAVRAADLAGSVEGASDLSHAAHHLEGYGA
jgi:predicted transcriptional regulator